MAVDDLGKRRFDTAVEARAREIGLFWQRAVFFWGFTAAAFVGAATSIGSHPRLALLLACFGLVCSVCWSLANRGSKYWCEAWEAKVRREEESIGGPLFTKIEPLKSDRRWPSARRYSVSRLAILLSDYVCFVWLSILVWLLIEVVDWHAPLSHWRDIFTLAFVVVTGLAVFLAWAATSSSVPDRSEDDG